MSTYPEQIDHNVTAMVRLAIQFKEAPKMRGYILALLQENQDLEQVFQDILRNRALSTAVGAQLDVIGEIVGQDRTREEVIANPFFGLKGAIGAETFGTIGDANVGGVFRSISDVEYESELLDDDAYRTFIRSKILRNKTTCTINEIIEIALSGIVADGVIVTEPATRKFKLTFTSPLTDREKLILTRTPYMAKPVCSMVSYADSNGPFG